MKVSARISDGFARREAMSQAIRRVMTWVLPVPAPATTSSGPSPCVTARSWSGFKPPSSASIPLGPPAAPVTAGSMTGTSSRQAGICSSGRRPAPPRPDDRAGHGEGFRGGNVVGDGGHVRTIVDPCDT